MGKLALGLAGYLSRGARLLRRRPATVLRLGVALLRGCWYALYFAAFRRDVRIRVPFYAHAPVRIEGPGRVRLEANCSVRLNVFRGLTIVTLSPTAEVHVGAGSTLGGVTIRCRSRVRLGPGVMTAASLVQDTLLLSPVAAPADRSAPVEVGANAWLGLGSCVLPGSRLGDDCVVAGGAACLGLSAEPYTLLAGNPAGRPLPIPRFLAMRSRT